MNVWDWIVVVIVYFMCKLIYEYFTTLIRVRAQARGMVEGVWTAIGGIIRKVQNLIGGNEDEFSKAEGLPGEKSGIQSHG